MSIPLNGHMSDPLFFKASLNNMEFTTTRVLLSAAVLYVVYHIANVRDTILRGTFRY